MTARMHHRKHGALFPWVAFVRYPGRAEFVFGTAYTQTLDAAEARSLLEAALNDHMPAGFVVRRVERGALIYRPHQGAQPKAKE